MPELTDVNTSGQSVRVLTLVLGLAVVAAIALGVPGCKVSGSAAGGGVTHVYYIAAQEVDWNYVPDGKNTAYGKPFDCMEAIYAQPGPNSIGPIYKKALYIEYTDSTFTKQKPVAPEWIHKGILGPVIRAEVGDTIQIYFKNETSFPASIHPHGVFYTKSNEGAPTNDGTNGAGTSIKPGESYHYMWTVPERAGPGPADPSSIVWIYHSHANDMADMYAGLMGPIIITRKGMAGPNGKPTDVDREFVTLFMIFDENLSPYLATNAAHYLQCAPVNTADFVEGNKKHAMNGYLFGNMPMPVMHVGERVRWYLLGMGNEDDLHTPHWHGSTVTEHGIREDVTELLPAVFKQVDMVPDDTGIWLFHCHVAEHMMAGMTGRYQILP